MKEKMMKRTLFFILVLCFIKPLYAQNNSYFDLSTKLQKHLEANITSEGNLPMMSEDENVARLIKQLTDERVFLSTPISTIDMPALMDMCDESQKIVWFYTLYGVQSQFENSQISTSEVSQQQKQQLLHTMEASKARHADELSRLFAFRISCLAKQIKPLETFFSSLKPEEKTPTRLQGIQQMQKGIYMMYKGALADLNQTELGSNYHNRVLRALAGHSSDFASVLPQEIKKTVHDMTQKQMPRASKAYHNDLKKIISAMKQNNCNSLCFGQ